MFPPAFAPPPPAVQIVAVATPAADADDVRVKPVKPGSIIGRAMQESDGSIVVILDTRFVNGAVLHTQHGYAPGTDGFKKVLADLGPFAQGQGKTVYATGIFAP